MVISADGRLAYVAVGASNEVVRVDLAGRKITGRVEVGREPRGLAITPDGSRLVVGNARGKSVSVVDLGRFAVERTLPVEADNLRQIAVSPDGHYAYVAAMNNRGFATTLNNIDKGWVLGQRVVRVTLDGSEPAESLSLDPLGDAAGDAHGLALAEGGKLLAVSCGGTHEVMLFVEDESRCPGGAGSAATSIEAGLQRDRSRFRRVPLGGRPTELAFAPDGKYPLRRELPGQRDPGRRRSFGLARPGRSRWAAQRLPRWSVGARPCSTTPTDRPTTGIAATPAIPTAIPAASISTPSTTAGRTSRPATSGAARRCRPSAGSPRPAPGPGTAGRPRLDDAMVESFTKSMQGKAPTKAEVEALVAYLGTLEFPRNPHREADGGLTPAAKRGEALFRSSKTNCSSCHSGPEFTDGKRHDVGLNERGDVYKGHNPPSLRGVYDKDPYLHDGRAKTLRDALTGDHAPENVGGEPISETELDDLIAYLKSL